MHKKWPKVVLKLLIPKTNHQELKLKEHQDKVVKEVEEVVKEVDAVEIEVVKEVDAEEIEVAEVAEVENSVVVEVEIVVDVVEIAVDVVEIVVDVVLKVDVAVLDQEPLLLLTMKEMKFLNILTEKDNPIKKIQMPLITVMKEDQVPVEEAEVKRKMVTEKVTGETGPRDNIKRKVLMVRLKPLKLLLRKSQLKLKKPRKKLLLKKSSVYLSKIISRIRLSSDVKLLERLKVSRVPRLLKMITRKSSLKPNSLLNQRLLLLLLLMERVKLSSDSQELKMM
jgi:hypothetical protein